MQPEVRESAFGGSPKSLVATLLDVDSVTPEVLADLKALIAAKEARGS